MALKTLENVKEIDGFNVIHSSNTKQQPISEDDFIIINHESNSITFKIQNGAIKENGINGCQVDTIIETARIIIRRLNKNFPCKENEKAISYLDDALFQLAERKKDRTLRNVEGYEKA